MAGLAGVSPSCGWCQVPALVPRPPWGVVFQVFMRESCLRVFFPGPEPGACLALENGRGPVLDLPTLPSVIQGRQCFGCSPLVCVKILSVILDLHPPLTYGDLGFLLGGFGWCHEADTAAKLTPWRLSPAELLLAQSLPPTHSVAGSLRCGGPRDPLDQPSECLLQQV